MKRKASEEIRESPTKPKRCTAVEEPSVGEAADDEDGSVPEATPANFKDSESATGGENGSAEITNGGERVTAEGIPVVQKETETPGDEEQAQLPETSDAKYEKEKHLKFAARDLIAQVQLCIESRRATRRKRMHPVEVTRQIEGLERLCRSSSKDAYQNPFLQSFPFEWFGEVGELGETIEELNNQQTALDKANEQFDLALGRVEAAAVKRGNALIGIGDKSPEAKRANDEDVARLTAELSEARAASFEAQQSYERQLASVQMQAKLPLRIAERALLAEEYVVGDKEAGSQRSSRRTSASKGSSSRAPRSVPERLEGQPLQEHAYHLGQGKGDEEALQTSAMADEIRERASWEIENAQKAWSEASREFHLVRNNYPGDLAIYLQTGDRHGKFRGTKREDAIAQQNYDHAPEAADEANAVSVNQRLRIWREDERNSRVSREYDLQKNPIWLNKAQEVWKLLENVKDGEALTGPVRVEDEVSLDDSEQLAMRQSLFTGKKRRLVDAWQKEQEKVRKALDMPTPTPSSPPPVESWDDSGLRWYEV